MQLLPILMLCRVCVKDESWLVQSVLSKARCLEPIRNFCLMQLPDQMFQFPLGRTASAFNTSNTAKFVHKFMNLWREKNTRFIARRAILQNHWKRLDRGGGLFPHRNKCVNFGETPDWSGIASSASAHSWHSN